MLSTELNDFRAAAYDFLLGQQKPLPTPAIARRLFGARRHEMPETQVVVRALLASDSRFIETHDRCWTVIGSRILQQGLMDATYAVVDLETTGSVIGVDEIIEIGLVHVRRGLAVPGVTGLCTLQLSRQLWPDLPSRSLPDLAGHFGIEHSNPHRAADDAAATAGVLLEALKTALGLGMVDLGDLFGAETFLAARRRDAEGMAAGSAES